MKFIYTLLILFSIFFSGQLYANHDIFVSTKGNDSYAGTSSKPFQTFSKAIEELKIYAGKEPVTIWFNEGTYYLDESILLDSELSGTEENPIIFSSLPGAKVMIKGSKLLNNLKWKEYEKGVFVASLHEDLDFDQLFVNGDRKIRSRYPNYDYENPLRGGTGYLQVSDGTNHRYDTWFSLNEKDMPVKNWENPSTGIVHAFQSHNWGNMQYRIAGIDKEERKVLLGEGGWQLQRSHGIGGKGINASWFFIDNIFEELDVAGEWFLNTDKNLLYYFPEQGIDITTAVFEVPLLKDLIQIKGSASKPVGHITIKGLDFSQSKTTFMETYEPVARGDWAIHRGGAIFIEGAEHIKIEDANFEYLGGAGVFMSGYNRYNTVSSCRFVHVGESAVAFVGSPSAVRFYQTWDDREIYGKDWDEMRKGMDLEPGPKSPDYPQNCIVQNSVMHDFGDYGKQVAGVYISMSHKITASHNTIYNCPRAGICINDGTWGGHIIEFNDIWETVRETGEHGPFNSWGRERQWRGGRGSDEHFIKELTKLDAIDNVIIRNNRIANYRKSISAGNWTIDLDDGSSYFEIYNNLNLGSTIKLRDGMARKVYNNITVSAVPLGWHVWPKDSEDEIYQNIFVISGAVPGKKEPTNRFIKDVALPTETKWSTNYDKNTYWNINNPVDFDVIQNVSMEAWQKKGYDVNAAVGNPLFIDPANGNYQVEENSPALKLGFRNFTMDQFGHQMTRIKPFGGEFEKEISVTLQADNNAGNNAKMFYTIDGSEPNTNSLIYTKAIKFQESTVLKARTFNAEGLPIGFTNETSFKKVDEVIHPSWYGTLLAGKYEGGNSIAKVKVLEKEVEGAILVDIANDPDLIDATGGYNYGCYIKSIDSNKGEMWLNAKMGKDWVIQKVNDERVQNIADLKKYLKKFNGQKVVITAARDYKQKQFNIEF